MSFTSETVTSEKLGALGLIASTIHKLGLIEKLDARLDLSEAKGGIVSHGRRAAAMILNGLGFMNSRLYMTPHFFEDKPVQELLGGTITASHLNDDCLGRCLDKIADYGTTKLYSEVAFEVAQEQDVLAHLMHLDTTNFVLYGRYDSDTEESPKPAHGHSKANRPDLKQVVLSLTLGGAANIPLWMEALDGNSSDKANFQDTVKRIQAFTKNLASAPDFLCFVGDAALYTPKKLAELDAVFWITRVPAQLKAACQLLQSTNEQLDWQKIDENYRYVEVGTTQHGIHQRWVLIASRQAEARELKTFQRQLDKKAEALQKELWHLNNQQFACESDAHNAIKPIIKGLKYHRIDYQIVPMMRYEKKGRPKPGAEKAAVGYQIQASLSSCLPLVQHARETLGRFILATNQLDEKVLNAPAILSQYKEQSNVESGFKFIKNDAFELDSFYLKNPRRIGALMMIMTLCLMVYNFAQYSIRKCLEESDEVLPNQAGKPVKNPTLKWVAELMDMIAVVTIQQEGKSHRIITNVKKVHRRIIAYFGPTALEIYGLPPDLKVVDIDCRNFKNITQWYRE
jgi:transposase